MTARQLTSDEQLHDLERDEALERSRSGLLNFTLSTFRGYQVNWHHRLICRVLNRFASGELRRVIVCMPPRVGKSELVSRRLPAYLLGRNPRTHVVGASYGHELAARTNRDVQRIIESAAYREIFPSTLLRGEHAASSTAWMKNSGIFEIVDYGGSYRAVGVGGALTGMGANHLILDDPTKNQEEADSFTHRQKVWEWYASTFWTRMEKNAGILITATRWHEDDLIGRLLALAKTDPLADQWEVISLPAIAEGEIHPADPRKLGEPLWPEKYDLKHLAAVKANGSRNWSALYQQRPSPDGGAIVKRHWWQFYTTPPESFDLVVQAWDLTFTKSATSDYVVGVVLGRKGSNIYLLDMVRDRLSFTDSIAAIKMLTCKWPMAVAKYVERAANGHALIDTLRHELPGLIAVAPTGSKVARANAVAPRIEAGNVWLPVQARAPWIGDVVEEWTAFPTGVNDDIVDAMSYGIAKIAEAPTTNFIPVSISGGTIFPVGRI